MTDSGKSGGAGSCADRCSLEPASASVLQLGAASFGADDVDRDLLLTGVGFGDVARDGAAEDTAEPMGGESDLFWLRKALPLPSSCDRFIGGETGHVSAGWLG